VNPTRRVVVSGLGIVSPLGIGKAEFWKNSCAQKLSLAHTQIGEGAAAQSVIAGTVAEFPTEEYVPPKIARQTDRSTHLAMAACRLAAEDARLNLESGDAANAGMFFSTLFGGMEFAEPELYAQTYLSPDRVSAYQAIAWFYAATQGQWSILKGLKGYAKTVVADRAGGLQAVSLGALSIERGHADMMFVGGFDAPLVPYTWLIHKSAGLLSPERHDPERAYLPFDRERTGMVLAEAAAILLLEEREHALRRGAPMYAEIAGSSYRAGAAKDEVQPSTLLERCIREALQRAGTEADDVNHILPEGLGTKADDEIESSAIRRVFGSSRPGVSVPKAMLGHALTAAGPTDCIWACLMMQTGTVLPTPPWAEPDSDLKLNHVRAVKRDVDLSHVLCLSRGHGNTNAALVLKRPQTVN
jgi:3-oxoacyl-(acyl-carrier-protein) synthase